MRRFYIIAYDITDERRLRKVRELLKGYSTGGQKSVYECFLTDGELRSVAAKLNVIIRHGEDRIHIFALDKRIKVHTLGRAVRPRDPAFFYFG